MAGCGITYDAAGNVIFDGTHHYTYDGENRIVSVDNEAAQYTYDAEGRRVRKQSAAGTVDYILDLSGRTVGEVAANGTFSRGEVYVGGRHLATYNNGTTYFVHSDWLGTERSRTDANAAMYEKCSNLPFGDMQQCAGSGDPSPNHFAGKERDTESNLDDFGARYFSSQYGRWMSPDWSATPTPIPYANMAYPQSLNLYGYASNDPVTGEDADGHFRVSTSCFDTGCDPEPPKKRPQKVEVRRRMAARALSMVNSEQMRRAPATLIGRLVMRTRWPKEESNTQIQIPETPCMLAVIAWLSRTRRAKVTQFKNTRANTQQRVKDGKWQPK